MLPRLPEADEFVMINLKERACLEQRIPHVEYPVHRESLDAILQEGGQLSIEILMRGLMQWVDVTDDAFSALTTLRLIMDEHFPPDGEGEGSSQLVDEEGIVHRFRVGSIDFGKPVVTWQRNDLALAFGQASLIEPGRMVVAAPKAISATVAESVVAHSILSYMLEPFDSILGVRSTADSNGSAYKALAGKTYPADWFLGYGISVNGGPDNPVESFHDFPPQSEWLAPNQVAVMVAIGAGYV